MTTSIDGDQERNSNHVEGSTLTGSPVVAGSRARVSVTVGHGDSDPDVTEAISGLRTALQETRNELDRRDDDTRETLALTADRLARLEEELAAPRAKRDWGRVTKLMTLIRDSVAGLTALTASADALWDAVQHAVH
jgi:sirohydrochlorin ferrochelatase